MPTLTQFGWASLLFLVIVFASMGVPSANPQPTLQCICGLVAVIATAVVIKAARN